MHNNPKQKNGQNSIFVCQSQTIPPLVYAFIFFTFFFSIFVLQVSYCLNISRGQMFWWWGRRDIWKRVGIFNLFFFGRKKISFYLLLSCPHKKEQKWAVFSKSHLQKLWHDEALIMGPPSSSMGVLDLFSIFNVLWARKLVYDLE